MIQKKMNVPESDILSGVDEISRFIRQCARTTGEQLKRGQLPGYRIGAKWLASRAVLTEWLADRCRANVTR